MSGWIKVDKDLIETIRFRRVVRKLRDSSNALRSVTENAEAFAVTVVLGALVRFWIYADSHIRDDDSLDIALDEINEIVGVDGFAQALPTEWLEIIDADHVKLPNFHEHNGSSEKLRRDNARRQAEYRHRHQLRNVTRDITVTNTSNDAREEKTREEKKKEKNGAHAPALGSSAEENPEGLNLEAWGIWQAYRKLKPKSIHFAKRKLATFGADQMAVVEHSIAGEYDGLFAPPKSAVQVQASTADKDRRKAADERALAELRTRAGRIQFRDFNPAIDDLLGYKTLVERAESNLPRRASS